MGSSAPRDRPAETQFLGQRACDETTSWRGISWTASKHERSEQEWAGADFSVPNLTDQGLFSIQACAIQSRGVQDFLNKSDVDQGQKANGRATQAWPNLGEHCKP